LIKKKESTRKRFNVHFGETLEPITNEAVITASAGTVVGLLDLKKFFKEYGNEDIEEYLINEIPKRDDRQQMLKFGDGYFDLNKIVEILNFLETNTVSAKVYDVYDSYWLFFQINNDYGFLLASLEAPKQILEKYHLLYNWNDIFKKQTFSSDMIL